MAAPTALELLTLFRREVDDILPTVDSTDDSDRLWKNAEILGYIDEAQHELARRTQAFLYVFRLPVVTGAAYVPLPSWLYEIQMVELVTANVTLRDANRVDGSKPLPLSDYGSLRSFADTRAGWNSTGTPMFFAMDAMQKQLRLGPVPSSDDTLEITGLTLPRTPLESMSDMSVFEDKRDIRLLLHFAKYLAYDKQDVDVLDKETSNTFLAKFLAGAKERELELNRFRMAPSPIRYNG